MQQAVAAGLVLLHSIQINDLHHRPNTTSLPGQLDNPGAFTQGLYRNYITTYVLVGIVHCTSPEARATTGISAIVG